MRKHTLIILLLVLLLPACVRQNQEVGKDIDFSFDVDGRTRT
jgi:hypothetical protein